MRLFVAIVPPPQALAELTDAVAQVRAARPELRWSSAEAWHLTLAFLGEVDEALVTGLATRMERAAGRHPPQRLAVRGAGAFPRPSRATVLWAGIEADRPALEALAGSVAAGARRAGAPPASENRRYRPHLTLARCREPADVADLIGTLDDFAGTPWTATSVSLIRSQLGGGPPRYETVGTWPLRKSG
jgi:RNA 2',3'-cyclic 3'-phosphodiesterase